MVVDTLVGGLTTGGIRLQPGVTLKEVEALARNMTLKNHLWGLPVGGCKLALDCAPNDSLAVPLLTRFLRAIRPFLETSVVTGPDLGTSRELIHAVFSRIGMVSPAQAALDLDPEPESSLMRLAEAESAMVGGRCIADLVGGYGVVEAADAGLHRLGIELGGARVAIQGFGAMGQAVAVCLAAKGARVVAVADVEGTVTDPAGLDVDRMARGASATGVIDRMALAPTTRLGRRGDWISTDAEVLVPAATGNAINQRNCDRVRAKLVVEAANLPTTREADRRLWEHGTLLIPDIVANWGTDAFYWWVLLGVVEPDAQAILARVRDAVRGMVA